MATSKKRSWEEPRSSIPISSGGQRRSWVALSSIATCQRSVTKDNKQIRQNKQIGKVKSIEFRHRISPLHFYDCLDAPSIGDRPFLQKQVPCFAMSKLRAVFQTNQHERSVGQGPELGTLLGQLQR